MQSDDVDAEHLRTRRMGATLPRVAFLGVRCDQEAVFGLWWL